MSDTRFILLGIGLIFAGFLVLGVFGQSHYEMSLQALEFGDCYRFEGGIQTEIDCQTAMQDRAIFFAAVAGLIAAGIFFLIKGVRGKWDQDVRPQDKVGPGTTFPG